MVFCGHNSLQAQEAMQADALNGSRLLHAIPQQAHSSKDAHGDSALAPCAALHDSQHYPEAFACFKPCADQGQCSSPICLGHHVLLGVALRNTPGRRSPGSKRQQTRATWMQSGSFVTWDTDPACGGRQGKTSIRPGVDWSATAQHSERLNPQAVWCLFAMTGRRGTGWIVLVGRPRWRRTVP